MRVAGGGDGRQVGGWPLMNPLEPAQMNPKHLLGYACKRIILEGCVAQSTRTTGLVPDCTCFPAVCGLAL